MTMPLRQPEHKKPFSVNLHWPKKKISGMVELGVLMKDRYRRRFGNYKILPDGGAKLGNFRK
jgi:hypothetical protein